MNIDQFSKDEIEKLKIEAEASRVAAREIRLTTLGR
jgi:hypothetical protein